MAFSFATSSPQARLANFLPFLRWAPLVNGRTTRADLLAGLTGAIVVLPQGVAFATIAGMPPQYGLYASIVPTIVAALFGSSWHLVAGPSTTASLVLAASLATFATPGTPDYVQLAMTLAIMTGLIELALGVFKLGVIVNFISHSVVIGYTAGVGMRVVHLGSRLFEVLRAHVCPDPQPDAEGFIAPRRRISPAFELSGAHERRCPLELLRGQ